MERLVRGLVFLCVGVFLVYGPMSRQLLEGTSEVFQGWQMFSTFGSNICDVRYRQMFPNGTSVELNRWDVLGKKTLKAISLRGYDLSMLESSNTNMCTTLVKRMRAAGDHTQLDLRVFARCGHRKGWSWAAVGDRNVCTDKEAIFWPSTPDYHPPVTPPVVLTSLAALLIAWILIDVPLRSFRTMMASFGRTYGPTRSVSLIRIGLPLLILARWGFAMLPYKHPTTPSVVVVFVSFFASSTLMFCGLFSRFSSAWMGTTVLAMYYEFGVVLSETFHHHHAYILALAPLILSLTPCGGFLALDRWREVRKTRHRKLLPPREEGNLWAVPLLTILLSTVYFWSAWEKTFHARFLSGDRLEQIFMTLYLGSDYPRNPLFRPFILFLSIATVVLEFALSIGVWFPRSKVVYMGILPCGILMHAIMYLFLPVYTFSATMWLLYLAVLPPEWVSDWIEKQLDRTSLVPVVPSIPVVPVVPVVPPMNSGEKSGGRWKWATLFVLAGVLMGAFAMGMILGAQGGRDIPISSPAAYPRVTVFNTSLSQHGFDDLPLGANGPIYRNNLQRTGYVGVRGPTTGIHPAWKRYGVNKNTHTANKGSAVFADGRILVGADTGVLFAFDLDGNMLWASSTEPSENGIHGTPLLYKGVAYVGAYDGAMYAFDVHTGTRLWRTQVGDYIGSSPALYNSVLYISAETDRPSGIMAALDVSTGRLQWIDKDIGGHSHSSVGIDPTHNVMVVGANDNRLYAWDLDTYRRRWTVQVGGDIKGPIALWNGLCFFGSFDHTFFAKSLDTGETVWTMTTGGKIMSGAGIDPIRGLVFFGSHDHLFYALNATTGEVVWSFEGDAGFKACPLVLENYVLVGCSDGYVYALDKDTGEEIWSFMDRGRVGQVLSTPALADGRIVFTTRSTQKEGSCFGMCVVPGSLYVLQGKHA